MAILSIAFALCMIIFLVILSLFVLLGVWVYRDAKSLKLNAPLWTAVVLLVPNFIGLLLYFLIGRREARVDCPYCHGNIQASAQFCTLCGQSLTGIPKTQIKKGVIKLLLAVFCALAVILITAIVMLSVFAIRSGRFSNESWSAMGMMENNFGSRWNMTFSSLDGTKLKTFTIRNANPDKISVDSLIESGEAEIEVTQGSIKSGITLMSGSEISTIDLKDFKNGSVTLSIKASHARGHINLIWN